MIILFSGENSMFIGLWLCFTLSKTSALIFSKLTSNRIGKKSVSDFARFLLINGLGACVFFLFLSKFQIKYSAATLLFAFIYAVIVILSLLQNVIAYRYIEISNLNVIRNGGSMAMSSITGFLLFNEPCTLKTVLRIVLLFATIFLIFLGSKKSETTKTEKKNGLIVGIIALVSVVLAAAGSILLKYYAITPTVTDTSSLFFLTNVILIVVTLFYLLLAPARSTNNEQREKLTLSKMLIFLCNTFFSNVTSLLQALLIARTDISVFSPLSTAFGILSGVAASLIFRERLKLFDWLAVSIAIIAIAI